jgi:hypothetical protein
MKPKLISQLTGCWIVKFNMDSKLPEVLDQHRTLLSDHGICALSDQGNVLPVEAITNLVGILYGTQRPDKEQIVKLLGGTKFKSMVDHSHQFWREK